MPRVLSFPIPVLVDSFDARGDGRSGGLKLRARDRMSEPLFTEQPSNPSHDEVREWLEAIGRGERYALGRLYDLHAKPLFGLAFRLLREKAEAEDVVHDVFVSLRDVSGSFDPERGSVLAWLTTITRNKALDRIRKSQRRAVLLSQAIPADFGWEAAPPAPTSNAEAPAPVSTTPEASPSAVAENSDRALVVKKAVSELPTEQRSALELAFFGGLTQQEIAEKLQEPLGTVKARIRRGLLHLREVIGGRL